VAITGRFDKCEVDWGEVDRLEHVAWAKARALEYVDMAERGTATDHAARLRDAVVSIISDVRKHPETAHLGGGSWAVSGFEKLKDRASAAEIRHWIDALE
jgi:hypothetical protein